MFIKTGQKAFILSYRVAPTYFLINTLHMSTNFQSMPGLKELENTVYENFLVLPH